MTQTARVLNYIEQYGSSSPKEAYELGIMRLAARISELKNMGHDIVSVRESARNRYGDTVTYSRYKKADASQKGSTHHHQKNNTETGGCQGDVD